MAAISVPAGRLELTDDSLKILLHMDGADGSTTFTDDTGRTITTGGNAQIDTAQSVFGGASGLFDGTGDYLTAPSSDDFSPGSGAFTIEARMRISSISGFLGITARRATTANYAPFNFGVDNATSKVQFLASATGSTWAVNYLSSSTVTTDTWYHVAVTRSGNTFTTWLDGVSVGTATSASTLMASASAVAIGAGAADGSLSFNGWIDEFAIFKGRALYSAQFIPPTAPRSYTRPTVTVVLPPVVISTGAGAVTATGSAPEITRYITPPVGSATLTGHAPEVTIPGTITPATATAAFTGSAPSLDIDYFIPVAAGSLAHTGSAPAVSINYYLTPPVGALTITGQAVLAAVPQFITGAAGAHTLTGQAVLPVIGVVALPSAGSMTITGQAGTAPVAWSFPTGSAAFTGSAPALYIGNYITVGAGAPIFTGQAFGNNLGMPAASGAITFTGSAPVDSQRTPISVGAGSMTITGQAPSIPVIASPSYNVVQIEALF